eukprot:c3471_g1_i1 orf=178-444(-)
MSSSVLFTEPGWTVPAIISRRVLSQFVLKGWVCRAYLAVAVVQAFQGIPEIDLPQEINGPVSRILVLVLTLILSSLLFSCAPRDPKFP